MIFYHVVYTVAPNMAHAFHQEMVDAGILEKTAQNPGCIRYDFYIPLEGDDDTVFLIEHWRDEESLKSHQAQAYRKTHADIKAKYCLNVDIKECQYLTL